MVEGALDVVVLLDFALMCSLWEDANEIIWPPAQHSRHWPEVISISALLMAFGTLFLGNMASVAPKLQVQVPQPHPSPHLGHPETRDAVYRYGVPKT